MFGPYNNKDVTACSLFSKGFESEEEMSFAAFEIAASARGDQRSNEDLFCILHALHLSTTFHVRNTRRQLERELRRQAKDFIKNRKTFTSQHIFAKFERHSKVTLLAICSAHNISVNRYTGTVDEIKDSIMTYFAAGDCFTGKKCASFPDTCESAKVEVSQSTFASSSCDTSSHNELLLSWLEKQTSTLSRLPLQRLLCVLDVEYSVIDSLRVLRSHLKKYITMFKSQIKKLAQQQVSISEKADIDAKLQNIRDHWPVPVPRSLKDKIIRLFREQTSSSVLASTVCSCCAELVLMSECEEANIADLNLDVLSRPDFRHQGQNDLAVDSNWLDDSVTSPTVAVGSLPSMPHTVLHPEGIHKKDGSNDFFLTLCKSCMSSLRCGNVPPLSLANHMFLGEVPDELKDLTVVEEAMIAKCRAKCWVIQLKEDYLDSSLSTSQRGVKGHIIVYPQRPSAIANILPPSINEMTTPICVIFVGSSPPTKEWLRTKAKPLAVRRENI
jgi:hypothetical protein